MCYSVYAIRSSCFLAMASRGSMLPKQGLGIAVRRFRHGRDLTQEALASDEGLRLSTLARIETGGNEARISTIMRLAHELGISAATLVGECETIMRRSR